MNIYGSISLILTIVAKPTIADFGFVVASSENVPDLEVCVAYNPEFAQFAKDLNAAKAYKVTDQFPNDACKPFSEKFNENLVIVKRKNCEFAEKALNVQNSNGKGVIIVSEDGITTPSANKSMTSKVEITVSLISNESYNDLKAYIGHGKDVKIRQYAPNMPPRWDPDSIIMWILAVATCAFGAWLQRVSYLSRFERAKKTDSDSANVNGNSESSDDVEDLDITIAQALIFFGMCSVSILLMYFFYDYLVYVIIGVFCYASSTALFDLIYPVFSPSACFSRNRLPPKSIPCIKTQPPIFGILLYLSCAAFAVIWAVYRKADFAWILQDILGCAFCIYMIKQLKLKSFKLTTVILILFLLYDIFYVFITPLFTKDKQSIMVHVATGGSGASKEELPMLFKLPKIIPSIYNKCTSLSYSMLGYGDVILPGLHVGFCAVWDAKISNNAVQKHVYYIAAVLGYGIGLILTFIALYFMNTGQPALLYLSPCCLLSTLLVALKRKELKEIWKGLEKIKTALLVNDISSTGQQEEQALLPDA